MNTTKKLALAAVLSALGVVILTVGSFIQVLDLSSAALAGFVIIIAVIELQKYYPVLMYSVISLLSLILIPNKFPALLFIFFGGFYPIFKAYVERFHYIAAWVVKFSMFNMFLAFLIIAVRILAEAGFLPPLENNNLYDFLGNFKIIVFAVANFVFLLYDIAMSRIINIYIIKVRRLLGLKNYF